MYFCIVNVFLFSERFQSILHTEVRGKKKERYLMQFLKDTKQSNHTRKGLHQLRKYKKVFIFGSACLLLSAFNISAEFTRQCVTTVFNNYQKECRNSQSICFLACIKAFWKTQVSGALRSYCNTQDREAETMAFSLLCIPFAICLWFHLLCSVFGYSLGSAHFICFFYVLLFLFLASLLFSHWLNLF